MPLALQVVAQNLAPGEHVSPQFADDPRFNNRWWSDGSAKSPVSYCSLYDDEQEVARAKVLHHAGIYAGYSTWSCPQGGVTEIDLIEVRPDLQRTGQGYGRRSVARLVATFGAPAVAMSLDEESDGFWRALRWTMHQHPDGDHYRSLYTSPPGYTPTDEGTA